jgi:hypothetical protein
VTRTRRPTKVDRMFIARVLAGRWYWCVSCRHCHTTIALCAANDDILPPQAIAEPIQCYSCLERADYRTGDCQRLKAQGEGVPWLRWDE